MTKKFKIIDEQTAWVVLENWLGTDIVPDDVEFFGWPILRINVKGDDYESSMNSSQMSALVEFKKTIGRSYAMVAHGAYDMRRLKSDEEEQIDFSTKIKKGSSIFETDLTPLVQALASAATAHPAATLAVGLIISLSIVAKSIILKHYEVRAQALEIEERAKLLNLGLNNKEKLEYEIYEKAIAKITTLFPQISQALPDTRHAFWHLATASANADTMNVAGIDFSGDDLEILSERRTRRLSKSKEISQSFSVSGIDKVNGIYRIKLSSPSMTVHAIYQRPQISERKVSQLFKCFKESRSITATITVKSIDKSQLAARLISFKLDKIEK